MSSMRGSILIVDPVEEVEMAFWENILRKYCCTFSMTCLAALLDLFCSWTVFCRSGSGLILRLHLPMGRIVILNRSPWNPRETSNACFQEVLGPWSCLRGFPNLTTIKLVYLIVVFPACNSYLVVKMRSHDFDLKVLWDISERSSPTLLI